MIKLLTEELVKLNNVLPTIIVVGYKHEMVEDLLGPEYLYSLQESQLGTGHAVLSAKEKVSAENVVILYGDMPFIKAGSLQKLIDLHCHNNSVMSMFTAFIDPEDELSTSLIGYGRIIRKNNHLARIVEFADATDQEKQVLEVNPGIYIFQTKWLFENLEKIKNSNKQEEYYLTDILEIAVNQNIEIQSLPIHFKEVYGINTQEHLKTAHKIG
jgi:bifunctional UDP-N-acetylglucosamine pyrophosphorylase/glucosamine-1-phosphate N-acetyltransferase